MAVSLVSHSRRLWVCACVLLAPLARAEQSSASSPSDTGAVQEVARPPAAEAPASLSLESPERSLPPGLSGEEEAPEGLGWTLVRTLLLFGAVLASIYLTLNVGLRRLMGLRGVPLGRPSVVSVVERVPLDQRRTLFVLKAADESLLGGGGEGGLQLLSKLDAEAVERIRAEPPPANVLPLSPFLQKLLARRDASPQATSQQPTGTQPPSAWRNP
jgi:flagellar protein FliO/FliZ